MTRPRVQIASLFERLETLDKVVDISQATWLRQSALHQPQAKKVVFAARAEHEQEEMT